MVLLLVQIHTTLICMSVFHRCNSFLRESIDLSSVTSVVRIANQCHNLVSSWIWVKQIQLGLWVYSLESNQTVLSYYKDWCSSTIFRESWSILYSLVTLEAQAGRGRVRNVRDFRKNDSKTENEWSQMSSCDLIRFSITVSFNHSERREMMKGWWRGDEEMKGFGKKGMES